MNRMTIPGTAAQPQAYNPYAPAAPYTPGVTPYAPQPTVAQPAYNPYTPAPQIPGVGIPQHQPQAAPYSPYAPAPTTPQIPGVAAPYNPYAIQGTTTQPYAAPTQPTYNPYAPAVAPQPTYTPAAPAAIPGIAPGYRPNPGILGAPQIPEVQPTYNLAVAPNPYAPTAPVQPQAYNPYTTVQPQSDYSQNVILSESEHIYNFLYSSSKTKKEIVDYIKERDSSYSSQESGGITTYLTIFGIYFVCDNAITNPNFLEAVLKSALIRNYRILDNGYVAFISEIAISCDESIIRDSIIRFAKYLCEKNYLLTLRKEQFIFTNSGNLIFIDFSSLIPKEYMMGLEKYLYSPSGGALYQEPSILFNNVDHLFIDILGKKYFKRNEIIEIEKRITNFNQLKRSVYR